MLSFWILPRIFPLMLLKQHGVFSYFKGGFFSNADEHSHLGNLTANSEEYQIEVLSIVDSLFVLF